jgi:hypothetical protein
MQKVKVIVSICGDYCAFHEMSFYIYYDITNDIQLDDYSLEDLNEDMERGYNGYSDLEIRDAYLIDGEYYVKW